LQILPLMASLRPWRYPMRQADQARTDIAAIESELEVIQAQLARMPTRRELAQTALLATLTGAALVLVGIEALFR
jgi:hypothetical protein